MTKTEYNALQALAQSSQMSAWEYILEHWNCKEWQTLPHEIKSILHLHASIGICSGMLVTRVGSLGVSSFVERLNKRTA